MNNKNVSVKQTLHIAAHENCPFIRDFPFIFSFFFCIFRHEKLDIIKGDIFNSESLVPVLEGKDAVLSCLGAHGTSVFRHTTLYSESMKSIMSAMEK